MCLYTVATGRIKLGFWTRRTYISVASRKEEGENESIKKVQFIGKTDLVLHSKTDYPVTLYDVYVLPDLGLNLFSFHVVE